MAERENKGEAAGDGGGHEAKGRGKAGSMDDEVDEEKKKDAAKKGKTEAKETGKKEAKAMTAVGGGKRPAGKRKAAPKAKKAKKSEKKEQKKEDDEDEDDEG